MPGTSRVELVRLTGQPRVVSGSDGVPFVPDKRYQLLAYLAYNGEWTGRERVAALFWPDTDTGTSKQNLRALLQRLKTVPWSEEVSVTPHQLLWAPPTDVARYRAALLEGREDEALAAYAGPLLAGLESDDDGEFSEWLQIEREKLRGDWRGVALARIRSSGAADARLAADLYRRLLDDDPLDEEAVRVYLGAMARAGRVDEARAAFRSFAASLREEMGLEPTSETVAAFLELDSIALPTPNQSETAAVASAETALAPDRLPTLSTTFIGRGVELGEIIDRLRDPACRMLTIAGPGGVGKTRLALRAAQELRADFDSVTFVPLDSLSSADEVPTAIAGALGVELVGGVKPLEQVARSLVTGRSLLLLDNFEQVLGAAPALVTLLGAGTGVKVLVSSRVRLGIEPEWLYPLEGLSYPSGRVEPGEALAHPAVELFVERARRVRPRFELDDEQLELVVRLCAVLDGLPLAIELAAAWVRALPLAEVLSGLESNLDLLESSGPDAIPRHRSIRATFEQSWSLLSEAERTAMRRLSVFRGPVHPAAAAFVAASPHVVLAALVDKSLLRLGYDGRYDRHPLLLAFAGEKLAESPDEHEVSEERHAAYYLRFLRERTDRARGPRPAPTLGEIDAELAEILAAARRARDAGKDEQLVAIMHLLEIDTGYLRARGYGSEVIELLEAAAGAATEAGWWRSAHDLTGRLGDVYGVYRGDLHRSVETYARAADLARRGGSVNREAIFLSMVGQHRARLEPSVWPEELDSALDLARSARDDLCLATVLEQRAMVLGSMGDFQASNELVRESLEAVERLATEQSIEPHELYRRRFFAIMTLGENEKNLGRTAEALPLRLEALRLAEESANTIWTAYALHELGALLGREGEHGTAKDLLVRAGSIYRENGVTAHLERLAGLMEELGYDGGLEEASL